MIAVLSLGANLGDPNTTLESALRSLGTKVIARSRIYRTAPVGGVEQDDFLNLAVLVMVQNPAESLTIVRELEAAAGRERAERWGPRTLDVDVIAIHDGETDVISDDPDLTLPHPRAHERRFVLEPWIDIEPEAILPGHGSIGTLAMALVGQDVSPL